MSIQDRLDKIKLNNQLNLAITQLKRTSDGLKAKEVDGLEEGDIADMYEDIDLCMDSIGKMGEGI